MASKNSVYVCSQCGEEYSKWQGQCTSCKEWDTIQQLNLGPTTGGKARKVHTWTGDAPKAITLVEGRVGNPMRIPTGVGELDRVLGGGMVSGSVTLLSGEPGIGKSTLLLQVCEWAGGLRPLYVSGEESVQQIADRAKRLGVKRPEIKMLADNYLEAILETIAREKPQLVVIDSIQTLYSDKLDSASGTVSQVRECALQLTRAAKQMGFCLWLVGHVTKDGNIAGPRILEHMVDTVLSFEGDDQALYRLIRAVKNRFGAANELGIFEMSEAGLQEVSNPTAIFLPETAKNNGSCICIVQEGPRAMLLEIQALLDESKLTNPRRLAIGVDKNRVDMLLAVLHKHGGLDVSGQDVFVNVVGGIKISEPAADLPIVLGMLSSFKNAPLPDKLACFGELGLTGEVRFTTRGENRIREAIKLGFQKILVPEKNLKKIEHPAWPAGVEVVGVKNLASALNQIGKW